MSDEDATHVAWIIGIFACAYLVVGWLQDRETTTALTVPTGRSLRVELARTPEARSKGLSHRDRLGESGLLLHWPDAGHHPIWMADVRFPLDLVWLDDEGQVLAVVPAAQPCPAQPCLLLDPPEARQAAQMVLELEAGAAAHHQLTIGTRILATAADGDAR